MKKDSTVLLIQLDGNLASDVSTRATSSWANRASGRNVGSYISSHQVESREPCNLSSRLKLFGMMQKII